MIPGVDLISFIEQVSVLGIALVIFAESGLLIGFFLPGDSLLFTAGFLVYAGHLSIPIAVLAMVVWIAAVAGDSVGYLFGRRIGSSLFSRPNSRIFKQENVQRAEAFYEKYGGKTIILARFIPVVRTFVPVIAGVSSMRYRTFITYNLIGGLLWSVGVTLLGFFVGSWFEHMGISIDKVLLPIVILIVILSILPPLIHLLRDSKQRKAFWAGTKRELAGIFKRK